MSSSVRIRRALISVHDKRDLLRLARALKEHDVEIISTGGTARALIDAGIAVVPIDEVTASPEMLDGRVKTLHPAIHGGILFRRDLTEHVSAVAAHGIKAIDLVCVNLYPFERTISQAGVTDDEAIEQIDIGGPSMVRSAAKNHAFVAVVTAPEQYDALIAELDANDGCTTLAFRRSAATTAFSRTSAYDATISAWMNRREGVLFPEMLPLSLTRHGLLRYGENPHQSAAAYRDSSSREPCVIGGEVLEGKALSYNNILDASAALEAVLDLRALNPGAVAVCVVKHTNPCGAALASDGRTAFLRAWEGDPLAAYGGIVAIAGVVDREAAELMVDGQRFLEVIVACAFTDDARDLLAARWKLLRLVAVGELGTPVSASMRYRSVPGGMLVQQADEGMQRGHEFTHAAGPAPSDSLRAEAAFAMTVVKHLKSNAICISAGAKLLGAGAGQMDRLAACRHAVEKAGERTRAVVASGGAVAASDAFFPFADGPALLADAGVKCLVHPGGSKRDQETFDLCNERGVTCLTTGVRHFRH